jgi:putative transposase
MDRPHRKRVKHFEGERHVHELTFSCVDRQPLLTNDLWRAWFCEVLECACDRHEFLLLAYVLMPEHVHLLVCPGGTESRVPNFLGDLKRQQSRRVKRHLVITGDPTLERLTVRQRPGVTTFRFWQEGPGYDRNLMSPTAITSAIEYIHANPVRRNLCKRAVDWTWSSAQRLMTDGTLDGTPRLSRFDPSLLTVETMRPRKEHSGQDDPEEGHC